MHRSSKNVVQLTPEHQIALQTGRGGGVRCRGKGVVWRETKGERGSEREREKSRESEKEIARAETARE